MLGQIPGQLSDVFLELANAVGKGFRRLHAREDQSRVMRIQAPPSLGMVRQNAVEHVPQKTEVLGTRPQEPGPNFGMPTSIEICLRHGNLEGANEVMLQGRSVCYDRL